MSRQLPALPLGLITIVITGMLLVGAVGYVIVNLETWPSNSAIIPQVNVQPADLPPREAHPRNKLLSPAEVTIIVETATGQKVTYVELERVRGITAYEVKAGSYEVFVDALTGQILYQKNENK